VVWLWLGAIAFWTLAGSAFLAAFSTFDVVWAGLIMAGLGLTAVWFGIAVFLSVRRRWTRKSALCWAAWPLAAGVVWLLHATDLPKTFRVAASGSALREFADAALAREHKAGRVGLVVVFDTRVREGCAFLTAGSSLDGVTGLVYAPGHSAPPPGHPDWAATSARHLTGPWWYFVTRT